MDEIKKCSYCGEEILAVAKKCKHCGEWLYNIDSNNDFDDFKAVPIVKERQIDRKIVNDIFSGIKINTKEGIKGGLNTVTVIASNTKHGIKDGMNIVADMASDARHGIKDGMNTLTEIASNAKQGVKQGMQDVKVNEVVDLAVNSGVIDLIPGGKIASAIWKLKRKSDSKKSQLKEAGAEVEIRNSSKINVKKIINT